MTPTFLSEHKRNTPLSTLIVVIIFGLLVAIGVTAVIAALSMPSTGALQWWESALLAGFGSLICGVFGFLLARFARRILPVRTIRLYDGGTLEITTIRGEKFSARLPDDVKHIVVADDGLSVTVKIAKRYFVVDSSEFTDGDRVKKFLHDSLRKSPS